MPANFVGLLAGEIAEPKADRIEDDPFGVDTGLGFGGTHGMVFGGEQRRLTSLGIEFPPGLRVTSIRGGGN